MPQPHEDQYQDIREAVRNLCAQFPAEYHRKIDEARGYPGLVVHGPLQATLLAHHAQDINSARPSRLSVRALTPVFDTADVTINAVAADDGMRLWTATPGGPVAMEAHASW